jgi:hypothetical protein
LHKLVKLVDRNVFKRTILTLADEPIKYLFKCILFTLLICKVEGIAGLLVKGGKSVCGVDEAVLQRIEVDFTRGVSNHLIWI